MFWSVQQRRENKKLRNAGLEYISRSGKTVAAKKQPGNRYQQYNIFVDQLYKMPFVTYNTMVQIGTVDLLALIRSHVRLEKRHYLTITSLINHCFQKPNLKMNKS